MPQNIHDVGSTMIEVSLYHLAKLIDQSPNTCSRLYLLRTYLNQPSRIEELYLMGVLNKRVPPCTDAPKFSYNQANSEWEWF